MYDINPDMGLDLGGLLGTAKAGCAQSELG